ncbi:MAG: Ldh family oxidoreductase [Cyclobacteriaceae bacterium]
MKTNENSDLIFNPESLRNFMFNMFRHCGVPVKDSELAAKVLAYSDEHGIDSHGIARLKTYYDLLKAGRVNPEPKIKVIRGKKSVACVDGDNGLGLVVGPKCMEMAIEKAQIHGSGWIAVCNTNHYGAAGYYPLMAIPHDMIGLSMTNTTKGVVPFNGIEKMLGTNPIAMAFPADKEEPLLVDFASSTVAYGKVEIAKRRGEQVPIGWCIDGNGLSTNDPAIMMEEGALLPLGSTKEGSGHKGYCIAAMVDILTAVLSGANWGPFGPSFAIKGQKYSREVGKGIGHFFGAWEIDGFRDIQAFKTNMDDWIKTMKATPHLPGKEKVMVPGDPEIRAYRERMAHGIPLNKEVVKEMEIISKETGISMPIGKE